MFTTEAAAEFWTGRRACWPQLRYSKGWTKLCNRRGTKMASLARLYNMPYDVEVSKAAT